MNKTRITQIGRELEGRLNVFFSDRAYGILCGKHWIDRNKKPEQVAFESIQVKMRKAERVKHFPQIVDLHYEVRSRQQSFVIASFNLMQGPNAGENSLPVFLLDAFKAKEFVNMGVEFVGPVHVWFVILDKETKLYYHVHLYPKFGHED